MSERTIFDRILDGEIPSDPAAFAHDRSGKAFAVLNAR